MKEHRWELRSEGRGADSSTTYACAGCGWWRFVNVGPDGEETRHEPPEGFGSRERRRDS